MRRVSEWMDVVNAGSLRQMLIVVELRCDRNKTILAFCNVRGSTVHENRAGRRGMGPFLELSESVVCSLTKKW